MRKSAEQRPSEEKPSMLDAALAHARAGRPVFPCNPMDKSPRTKNGFYDATTDQAKIRGWWQRHPSALIGLRTGAASGIVVVDIDAKNGRNGFSHLPGWDRLSPVIARTPSGGAHLYFRHDEYVESSHDDIAPGIEVKADGRYVIAPPTPGYAWINGSDLSNLPPLPGELRPPPGRRRRRRAANVLFFPPPPPWLVDRAKRDAGKGLSSDPQDLPPPPPREWMEAVLEVTPSHDYPNWIKIGAALQHELGEDGRAIFHAWSAKSSKYDAKECDEKYDELAKFSAYTAGTIFYLADQHDPFWRDRARETETDRAASASSPKDAERKPDKLDALLKSASDLRLQTFEPLKWVVPHHIPEGVTLLVGKPKVGKSWLALDIAIAVATGGACMGEQCEQGDVLALLLEDNDRRIQDRLTIMLGAHKQSWPERLTYATEWPLLSEGGVDYMRRWIGRSDKPRLVVLDVLQRLRARSSGKETQYEADYRAMADVQRLASEARVSIVVVHHQRKLSADDPFDTVSGTQGLNGAADGTLILQRGKHGDKQLQGRGRDLEEFRLAVEQDSAMRWRVLGDAEATEGTAERAAIIGALRKAGKPLTIRDIAETVGSKPANTKKMLSVMSHAGEVERVATGVYALPKGQRELDLEPDPL